MATTSAMISRHTNTKRTAAIAAMISGRKDLDMLLSISPSVVTPVEKIMSVYVNSESGGIIIYEIKLCNIIVHLA